MIGKIKIDGKSYKAVNPRYFHDIGAIACFVFDGIEKRFAVWRNGHWSWFSKLYEDRT